MFAKLQRFVPMLAAFGSGAAVMSLELLGSRIVAPYLGSSVIIWTNLIGVVLLAMAFGAWLGGRIADTYPDIRMVSIALGISGLWCLGLVLCSDILLRPLTALSFSSAAMLASLFFFLFPACLLACISPAVLRLSATDVDSLGHIAGTLSAFGTLGSLFGTYLTGYVLLPRFPLHQLLLGLSALLLIAAICLFRPWPKQKKTASGAALALLLPSISLFPLEMQQTVYPSAYADVRVARGNYHGDDAVMLMINTGRHAVGYAQQPENSVLGYVHGFEAVDAFVPSIRRVLVLGGGGFHAVTSLQKRHPDAEIEVVEIDPAIVAAAKKQMGFVPSSKTQILLEDARTAVPRLSGTYDLIISDVFGGDISVPWHVITKQALQEVSSKLSEQGIYVANLIFAADPQLEETKRYSRNVVATFQSAFSWIILVDMMNSPSKDIPSNVLLFAGNGKKPEATTVLAEVQKRLPKQAVTQIPPLDGGMVWTDDFGNADYQSVQMYRAAWNK